MSDMKIIKDKDGHVKRIEGFNGACDKATFVRPDDFELGIPREKLRELIAQRYKDALEILSK